RLSNTNRSGSLPLKPRLRLDAEHLAATDRRSEIRHIQRAVVPDRDRRWTGQARDHGRSCPIRRDTDNVAREREEGRSGRMLEDVEAPVRSERDVDDRGE